MAAQTIVLAKSEVGVAVLSYDDATLLATGVTIANINGTTAVSFYITIASVNFIATAQPGMTTAIVFPVAVAIVLNPPDIVISGLNSYGIGVGAGIGATGAIA
jgi:hypothetical protein